MNQENKICYFNTKIEKIRYLEKMYEEFAKKKGVWKLEEEILKFQKSDFNFKNVEKIVEWKDPVYKKFKKKSFKLNTEANVQKITKEAFSKIKEGEKCRENDIKEAIEILDTLDGVGVPVATAILMTYDQDRFTVMDWRVWNILFLCCRLDRPFPKTVTADDYPPYLKACQNLASELRISLRTLDRALWISSKNYSEMTL